MRKHLRENRPEAGRGAHAAATNPWESPRRTRGLAVVTGLGRGIVGAMAMSGTRQLAAGLGIISQTPPQAILEEPIPWFVRNVPEDRRTAIIELAHWAYGGTAGAVFGLLPDRVRYLWGIGPAYGAATWALFELGIAPLFGLAHIRQSRPRERAALLVDHILYGLVVGAPPKVRTR